MASVLDRIVSNAVERAIERAGTKLADSDRTELAASLRGDLVDGLAGTSATRSLEWRIREAAGESSSAPDCVADGVFGSYLILTNADGSVLLGHPNEDATVTHPNLTLAKAAAQRHHDGIVGSFLLSDADPSIPRVAAWGPADWRATLPSRVPLVLHDERTEENPVAFFDAPPNEDSIRKETWEAAITAVRMMACQSSADARTVERSDAYDDACKDMVEALVDDGPSEWLTARLKGADHAVAAEITASQLRRDRSEAVRIVKALVSCLGSREGNAELRNLVDEASGVVDAIKRREEGNSLLFST